MRASRGGEKGNHHSQSASGASEGAVHIRRETPSEVRVSTPLISVIPKMPSSRKRNLLPRGPNDLETRLRGLSPDMRYDLPWPHHRIARLAMERGRELGHVRERRIHAPLLGRVGIDGDTRSQRRRARVLAIALCVRDEVALLRREATDETRTAVALEGTLEGVESREHTAVVGDILAQRETAIHMEGVHLDVAVVLLDDQCRLLGEVHGVGGQPPVAQITRGVVMTPFVVESVGELVTGPAATE